MCWATCMAVHACQSARALWRRVVQSRWTRRPSLSRQPVCRAASARRSPQAAPSARRHLRARALPRGSGAGTPRAIDARARAGVRVHVSVRAQVGCAVVCVCSVRPGSDRSSFRRANVGLRVRRVRRQPRGESGRHWCLHGHGTVGPSSWQAGSAIGRLPPRPWERRPLRSGRTGRKSACRNRAKRSALVCRPALADGGRCRLGARASNALQCREGPGSAGRFCRAGVRSTGPVGSAPPAMPTFRRDTLAFPCCGFSARLQLAVARRGSSAPVSSRGAHEVLTVLMGYSQALMGYSQVPSARWRLTLSASSLPAGS